MPKILLIAICSILILTSCKKEHKKEKLNEANKETVSFPVDFPELKESEIKQFKEEIHSFYTSKINLDDFSGSFLVAKN